MLKGWRFGIKLKKNVTVLLFEHELKWIAGALFQRYRVMSIDVVTSAVFDGHFESRITPGVGEDILPVLLKRQFLVFKTLPNIRSIPVGCSIEGRVEDLVAIIACPAKAASARVTEGRLTGFAFHLVLFWVEENIL